MRRPAKGDDARDGAAIREPTRGHPYYRAGPKPAIGNALSATDGTGRTSGPPPGKTPRFIAAIARPTNRPRRGRVSVWYGHPPGNPVTLLPTAGGLTH